MLQIEHDTQIGNTFFRVTLDDGFTCLLYYLGDKGLYSDEYILELAEQRRETRSSFKIEENIRRGYYKDGDKPYTREKEVRPEGEAKQHLLGSVPEEAADVDSSEPTPDS